MFKVDNNNNYVLIKRNTDGEIVAITELKSTYELVALLSKMLNNNDSNFPYLHRNKKWCKFNFTGKDLECTATIKATIFIGTDNKEHYHREVEEQLTLRPYTIYKDGSIVDPRQFDKEIDKYREDKVRAEVYKYRRKDDFIVGEEYCRYRLSKYRYKFRRGPVPGIGKRRRGSKYYRHPKTYHNMKLITDPEYTKYLRKKGIYAIRGYWWDDFPRTLTRSWKDNSKCRKQWQKNINK